MVSEQLNRGLRNVVLDRTESSYIDGEQGILLYRGYNIHDLAQKSSFEEVCYLLIHGVLPTQEELGAFDKRLRGLRAIPAETIETIRLNQRAHPVSIHCRPEALSGAPHAPLLRPASHRATGP